MLASFRRHAIALTFFLECLIPTCLTATESLQNFPFHKDYPSPCDEITKPCYDLPRLTSHALVFSYDSREEIEKLFQVRKLALEKLGKILPHLNIGSIPGIIDLNIIELASSFVGFLFPNRWLDWKAQRRQVDVELESFKTLLANRTNAVQDIYYSIQMQIWNIRILKHYISQIKGLVKELKKQKNDQVRPVTDESIGVLKNLIAKLKFDLAYQDNLSATYPQLAQALGIKLHLSGNEFVLKPENIRSLKEEPKAVESDFSDRAIEKSTELKGLDKMIQAARLNKKSNYFDFFDPNGNDLGFGYAQRIKISSSVTKILEIRKEQTESQILLNVFEAVNNHNDALAGCNAAEKGLSYLEDIRSDFEEHAFRSSQPFDVNRAMRYFQIASDSAIRYSTSYFLFVTAKASLDRYVWNGDLYGLVEDYIKNNLEDSYKEVKKSHSFFYRLFHKNHEEKKEEG